VYAPLLFTALLTCLALFQVALACGAPLGRYAWGGRHRVLPRGLRIGSLAAIAIYAVIAAVVLDRAGLIEVLPESASRTAAWVVFAYLVSATGLNAISRSRRERYAMTPVSAALALLCLVIAG
jgi:hypothetical protein